MNLGVFIINFFYAFIPREGFVFGIFGGRNDKGDVISIISIGSRCRNLYSLVDINSEIKNRTITLLNFGTESNGNLFGILNFIVEVNEEKYIFGLFNFLAFKGRVYGLFNILSVSNRTFKGIVNFLCFALGKSFGAINISCFSKKGAYGLLNFIAYGEEVVSLFNILVYAKDESFGAILNIFSKADNDSNSYGFNIFSFSNGDSIGVCFNIFTRAELNSGGIFNFFSLNKDGITSGLFNFCSFSEEVDFKINFLSFSKNAPDAWIHFFPFIKSEKGWKFYMKEKTAE